MLPSSTLENIEFKHRQMANSLSKKVAGVPIHDGKDYTGQPLTLPMMFFKDEDDNQKVIRDGFDILKYIMERDISDFASHFNANVDKMQEWNEKLNTVMRFLRGKAVDVNENVVRYFIPSFLAYVPGLTRLLQYLTSSMLAKKYYEIDSAIKQEDVEKILGDANTILEENQFLVGDKFSYADIFLCV